MAVRRTHLVRGLLLLSSWLLVALPAGALVTINSSSQTVLAGHEVVVRPTLDGWATFDFGPYLPDFRYPSSSQVGARIDLGKTTAQSYDRLIERYAVIAAQPEGQIAKLQRVVRDLVLRGALGGALIGLAAPGVVLLVGRRRWDDLASRMTVRRAVLTGLGLVVGSFAVVQVYPLDGEPQVEEESWRPLEEALPSLRIPAEAEPLEIDSNLVTNGTAQLVESLVTSYRSSLTFYTDLEAMASTIGPQLHQPGSGEIVALLVSDRHDNIRMDPVAREVARQGQASILIDAGDDTSTGSEWEAFSLESLNAAFDDLDFRYAVAGNHDHGDFVTRTLRKLGFTTLVGEPVDGPEGITIFGVSDPRSSGLGSWRDEKGISFAEQSERIADFACDGDAKGERISTLVVHDAASAREALTRGCVDLVLAGHLHDQVGPERVVGSNGQVGYRYTNGTTGGAAYAIALGSKLRRDAEVTLVTYRGGRPVGLQPVVMRTVGDIQVGDYVPLTPGGGTAPE